MSQSGGGIQGTRANTPRPISSTVDGSDERLMVDAKISGVVELNLDHDADEVTTANTSDGGTTRALTAGDTSGRTIVVGGAAAGAAAAGNPLLVAGSDSGTVRTVAVNADGEIGVHDGGNSLTVDGTVTVQDGGSTISVDDGGGSLTVDGTVNVQDGGGSLTVDGTVELGATSLAALEEIQISEITTADLDTGAGTDTRAVMGLVGSASGGGQLIPGSATDGLLVDLGANNDVTVTGTVTATDGGGSLTVDGTVAVSAVTPGTSATSLGKAEDAAHSSGDTGVFMLGVRNDSATTLAGTIGDYSGIATDAAGRIGISDLGGTISVDDGNGVLTVDGTVTVSDGGGSLTIDGSIHINNSNLSGAVNIQDGGNSITVDGSVEAVQSGAWSVSAAGDVAHDAADSGNPVKVGARAVNHGATPTEVAAGDRTDLLSNRQGVPFVMGGVPNVIRREYRWDSAQTNDDVLETVGASEAIVVTSYLLTVSSATTAAVSVRCGFGTASVPAEPADGASVAGMLLSHSGVVPGGGVSQGDGSGIIASGAAGEELRITAGAPSSGSARLLVSYYKVAI